VIFFTSERRQKPRVAHQLKPFTGYELAEKKLFPAK
jgi:hypothetical protein